MVITPEMLAAGGLAYLGAIADDTPSEPAARHIFEAMVAARDRENAAYYRETFEKMNAAK